MYSVYVYMYNCKKKSVKVAKYPLVKHKFYGNILTNIDIFLQLNVIERIMQTLSKFP